MPPRHPTPADSPKYAFGLTQEDGRRHGFGGAYTHYRLRAFSVESPYPGLPADWRDVANLYRDWVFAVRHAYFYQKKRARAADGPVDKMSPHTVVCNYGLDGPIPTNAADPNLSRDWLEIHPIKLPEADVRGNKNDSLQDILMRIRAKVNTTDGKIQLEAQVWGFEMGGF